MLHSSNLSIISQPDIEPPITIIESPIKQLPAGSCDCHAHLFGPQQNYPYKNYRSYTPHDATERDYRHLLQKLGFQRAVLVQPSVYGTDNSKLLDTLSSLPQKDEMQWRGIAVIDNSVSDEELFMMNTLGIKGIRFNLLFKGGTNLDELLILANRIKNLQWHVQLLLDFSTNDIPLSLLHSLPVPCIIDHMGHIPTHKGINNLGFQSLMRLLDKGNSWVKISGFNRISSKPKAPFTDIDPFSNVLIKNYSERCVFGTDWPHVQLKAPMPNDTDLVNEFLRLVSDSLAQQQILVENPKKLYGFNEF